MWAMDNFMQRPLAIWASGVVHPESKQILSYIRRGRHMPFETVDVNQLRKDTIAFGQSTCSMGCAQWAE